MSFHRLGGNRSLSRNNSLNSQVPRLCLGCCCSPLFALISVISCFSSLVKLLRPFSFPGTSGVLLPALQSMQPFPLQCISWFTRLELLLVWSSCDLYEQPKPLRCCQKERFPVALPNPLPSRILWGAVNCTEGWLCAASLWFFKPWFGNHRYREGWPG